MDNQWEAARRQTRLRGQHRAGAQQPLSGTRCATTTDHVGSRGVGGGRTPDSHRAAVRRHRSPRGQRGEEGGPQAAAENWRTATPVTGAGRGGQRGGSRVWWGMDSHRKAACATAKVVGRRGGAGGAAQVWKGSESHREGAPYARRNQDEAGCQQTGGTVGYGLCDKGGAARAERAAPRLARLKCGGASATMSYLMVSRHRRESSPPMASANDNKHLTRHPS